DDSNNILTTSDENGNSVRQYFDGLGRQAKVERWNGTAPYSVETYTYNWHGGVATKTTAAGNTYTYTYDSSGRLTRATNPDATYQMVSYDDVNNVKTVTDEDGHQRQPDPFHLRDEQSRQGHQSEQLDRHLHLRCERQQADDCRPLVIVLLLLRREEQADERNRGHRRRQVLHPLHLRQCRQS